MTEGWSNPEVAADTIGRLPWTSRRAIPALLVVATVIPAAALGWMSLRILQQDGDVERQRKRESLEYAAARLARALEGKLDAIEERLSAGQGLRFTSAGVQGFQGDMVLFQPVPAVSGGIAADTF